MVLIINICVIGQSLESESDVNSVLYFYIHKAVSLF